MTQNYLIPPYGEVITFGVTFPLTHFPNMLSLPDITSKIGGVSAIVIRKTFHAGNKLHYNFELTQLYCLKYTINKTRIHTLSMLYFEHAEAHSSPGDPRVHPTSESLLAVTQTHVVTESWVTQLVQR